MNRFSLWFFGIILMIGLVIEAVVALAEWFQKTVVPAIIVLFQVVGIGILAISSLALIVWLVTQAWPWACQSISEWRSNFKQRRLERKENARRRREQRDDILFQKKQALLKKHRHRDWIKAGMIKHKETILKKEASLNRKIDALFRTIQRKESNKSRYLEFISAPSLDNLDRDRIQSDIVRIEEEIECMHETRVIYESRALSIKYRLMKTDEMYEDHINGHDHLYSDETEKYIESLNASIRDADQKLRKIGYEYLDEEPLGELVGNPGEDEQLELMDWFTLNLILKKLRIHRWA